jgi:NADH-quinone oxidoreductase subunit G
MHVDPIVDLAGRDSWERALDQASTIVAHAAFLTDGLSEHATVVFPAESYAEKDGTITHPDGRLQRLRQAIAHPGDTRAEWSVLVDLAQRLGLDLEVVSGPAATRQLVEAVPFYAGLTLEEIGGRGVRWQDRDAAEAFPSASLGPFELEAPPAAPQPNGRLRLGTFRSIWNATEVRVSPALHFLHPELRVEMSPADAQRLNVFEGEQVAVGGDGGVLDAKVVVRGDAPEGTVYLETTALEGPLVEVRKIR